MLAANPGEEDVLLPGIWRLQAVIESEERAPQELEAQETQPKGKLILVFIRDAIAILTPTIVENKRK